MKPARGGLDCQSQRLWFWRGDARRRIARPQLHRTYRDFNICQLEGEEADALAMRFLDRELVDPEEGGPGQFGETQREGKYINELRKLDG